MSSNAADDEPASTAAAYIGRVSARGSFRGEKAVLLVTHLGLALHRPGRFEKYRTIPYEEINFFDLRRRWNGMVLTIGTHGEELHFRFFRPRGDLAAIVVSLNQRRQANTRKLGPRYALTQVSPEAGENTTIHQTNVPPRQAAVDELFANATSSPGKTGLSASSTDRRDGGQYGTAARRTGSAARVFAGDRANFAPLFRALPKLIIFCLALYSVVASGMWEKGIHTIASWLSVPGQQEEVTQPAVIEEPLPAEVQVPRPPAEDNLAHVRIDLSRHPNLAGLLKAQRTALKLTLEHAAEEAHLDPSTVERIESATEVVNLADFLKYAKVIQLDVNTVRNVMDHR